MEYQKSYIYKPEDRPAKRRRIEPQGLQTSWPTRRRAYEEAWQARETDIAARLETINATTITEVLDFLDDTATDPPVDKIAAGFVLAGPNSTLYKSLTTRLAAGSEEGDRRPRRICVTISSNAGTNLKSVLKTIIRLATSQSSADDDDDNDDGPLQGATSNGRSSNRQRLLSYDLQTLHEYVKEQQIQQVVLALEDTEAFDSQLLSELLALLHCWQDRFHVALLCHVATAVDFLQQRLTQAAVACVRGRVFDSALAVDELEEVVQALSVPETKLWIGAGLMEMLVERQRDFTQSVESLIAGVRYAYMASYYANALSIFLAPTDHTDIPPDHFQALRTTDSFRNHVEELLEDGQRSHVRELLDSDQALYELVCQQVANGQESLGRAMQATAVVRTIQQHVADNSQPTSITNLYMQIMAGTLRDSPLLRSLLLSVRKLPSDVILALLRSLVDLPLPVDIKTDGQTIYAALETLVAEQEDDSAGQPLRSADDVRHATTLRTTIVAQKVELSKHKAELSAQDTAYTLLLRRLSDLLEKYFRRVLVDPQTLPMREIFLYDLRSPHREVLMPRPRHAVERALAAPHDYLDCACCGTAQERGGSGGGNEIGGDGALAASQPPTAVLYQLYLESGNLINVHDLWQAYEAVMGGEDEQRAAALFQRGLAELRYLGMVKSTRRRVDHIAKVAWRGL